jgi:hypothetical protein
MWKKTPNSGDWIELLMKLKGYETGNEAAAFLDVTRQSISQWRGGDAQMDALTAAKLGLAVGANPLYVIASTSWHNAKTEAKKKGWEIMMGPIEPKHPDERKKRPRGPRVPGGKRTE